MLSIGVLHAKWDERPLLLIVKAAGQDPTKESINSFLEDKVAKWWLPDDIVSALFFYSSSKN